MSGAEHRPIWLELDDRFSDVVKPANFPTGIVRYRNREAEQRLGLHTLDEREHKERFWGFRPFPKNLPEPRALRYFGHQFQNWNPQLGDGRGFLFAQFCDVESGEILDLATKGSGTTPWSRGGDGRLTLKGGVREVLATEMLEAYGVRTSRTFSLYETGESLHRNDEPSPTRASVLVRLGRSHIRFGTFQRLAYLRDSEGISQLVDYVTRHHLPHLTGAASPALALISDVARSTAALCAQWMACGFVHGVLNTDNMNVCGESFDYGPYRFLPNFDPLFTAAYFDHSGLYAYGRQPAACAWNIRRFAECFQGLVDQAAFYAAAEEFLPAFEAAYPREFLRQLGIAPRGSDSDAELMQLGNEFLGVSQVPYRQFFHDWCGGAQSASRAARSPVASAYDGAAFSEFRRKLRRYDAAPNVDFSHEYFLRAEPVSLHISEIERVWAPIAARDDWSEFERKLSDIRQAREALSLAAR